MTRSSPSRLLPVLIASPQDKGSRDKAGFGAGGTRNGCASRLSSFYAAQMLGQDGQRRGLRGGDPVRYAARSAYLGAEYSGENDRRPCSGLITKTAI
jgi:hypothetical protein